MPARGKLRLSCITATVAIALLTGIPDAVAQLGANCSISTSGVAFGTYDVFSPSPRTSTGTITYSCSLGLLIRVELASGSSGTFVNRTLRNGVDSLLYNLYTDSGYATVWGNGSGGTGVYSSFVVLGPPVNVPVYGRVPAAQNVSSGSYSDTVIATIQF
jgi:spore coat protein U-like protein